MDRGSIILVVGTDAPLDARQLKRLARRGFVGVGRTGSFVGDGSGDVAVAFSSAYRIPHTPPEGGVCVHETLHESYIDPFFKGAAEAAEEAILNALVAASPLKGRDGHERRSLSEFLPALLRRRLPDT
jgi:D-aminopeptidase